MKPNFDQPSSSTPSLLSFLFSFLEVCENLKEMVPNNIRTMRMAKEIQELTRNPPHGITCWSKNDRNDLLEAIVQGSKETPYENGNFRIDIVIPDRYPMDPPQLKFLTKVYHPNIDNSTGLICLDVLKMPPHGRWRPVNNLSLILTAVQQLLSDPNPHDPLDAAIAQEYIANRSLFLENAKKWTQLYAMDTCSTNRQPTKRKSLDDETPSEDTNKRPRSLSPSNNVEARSDNCNEEPRQKDVENETPLDHLPETSESTLKRKRVNEVLSDNMKRSNAVSSPEDTDSSIEL